MSERALTALGLAQRDDGVLIVPAGAIVSFTQIDWADAGAPFALIWRQRRTVDVRLKRNPPCSLSGMTKSVYEI